MQSHLAVEATNRPFGEDERLEKQDESAAGMEEEGEEQEDAAVDEEALRNEAD